MSDSVCSFPECGRPIHRRDICRSHYKQRLKGVDLHPIGRPGRKSEFETTEEAFWAKVSIGSQCWEWTGAKDVQGYGVLKYKGTRTLAHRYSAQLQAKRDITGEIVDHLCHNTSCVNPDHLRLTDHSGNMQNLRGAQANSKSGIRGVNYDAFNRRWRASVKYGNRQIVKVFTDPKEAGEWAAKIRAKHHK